MLFHLKEPDYKKEFQDNVVTRFYGRNPQQILNALDCYLERAKREGAIKDPNLVWWLKRKYTSQDIEEVEKGFFVFISGMIYMGEEVKDKPLFEPIDITNDFRVFVPEENIGYFSLWRTNILKKEEGELYRLQNPIEFYMNISFVPRDIAEAIMNYDLSRYRSVVEEDIARREKISRNPHIKVDGLQRILEGQKRTITLSTQN